MRKTCLIVCILLMLCLCATAFAEADAGISVARAAAPKAITLTLDKSLVQIDLAKDAPTFQLTPTTVPAGVKVYWSSSNKAVATVRDGLVTVKKVGTVRIKALAKGTKKWIGCVVMVSDSLRPTSMSFDSVRVSMRAFETLRLTPRLEPAGTIQDVTYSSSRRSVATVAADGTVTAHKTGTTIIRVTSVRNPSLKRNVRVTVQKSIVPKRLAILPVESSIEAGKSRQLIARPDPIEASGAVTWTSDNPQVALVSQTGLLVAKMEGEATITATSRASKKISVSRTIRVTWDGSAATLRIANEGDILLTEGDKHTLSYTLAPVGGRVHWASSDASVVKVDKNGMLRAVKGGEATIRATAGNASATVKVSVLKNPLSAVVPLRRSEVSEISANIEKIDAILRSAKAVVGTLENSELITEADAAKRVKILEAAFNQYRFPWMTEKRQRYWTNRFRGLKDFLPGVVYYGLPYIQYGNSSNGMNRRYNDKKAVSGGYFRASGKGYYLLNTAKKRNGMYVGSDCSSFVGMCIWGTGSSAAYWRTSTIVSNSRYRTLKSYDLLRPGDIIVRGHDHVVMFLYFMDAEKTRMMIIEQGGGNLSDDLRQTISCQIVNVSAYKGRYKPRRVASLGR